MKAALRIAVRALVVALGVVGAASCEERQGTMHYEETDHLKACAAACRDVGKVMARYNDTSGECACEPLAAPAASSSSSSSKDGAP